MSLTAELGSAMSSIESISERLGATLSELGDEHPASPGLIDVERSLRTAVRRLDRMLRDMR